MSTPTPTPPRQPSAVDRVFHIPELLESILQHLTMKDLLLSQRTSRTFRDTTQTSIRLKRKLFFEPDWTLEGRVFDAYAALNRPGRKPENNRLLLRAFPGCYPTITLVIVNDGSSSTPGSGGGQTHFATPNSHRDRSGSLTEHWSWDVCISFPADGKPDLHPSVLDPSASWRKMYLSQPPCTDLYLVRRWQRSLRPALIRDKGVTMGDLFDEATKGTPGCEDRAWHESYISSDRDWHFEGHLKCSSVEECSVSPEGTYPNSNLVQLLERYPYSRKVEGGKFRAYSGHWDLDVAVKLFWRLED